MHRRCILTSAVHADCGMVYVGFAGQSENLSTNHLIQCLSQHVNEMMEVKVVRPDAGTLTLKIKVSEALQ